jgi:hypothetical protein
MLFSTIEHVSDENKKAKGKKYCAYHQGEAPRDAGTLVMRGKARRWICFACQEKNRNGGVRL